VNGQPPDRRGEPFPAQRYETLRRAALGSATAVANARGLALLMRHGMAAWMRAWRRCAAPTRLPERGARGAAPAVRPEMVAVLAEMALAAAREEVRP
jgi:hypothetical protein